MSSNKGSITSPKVTSVAIKRPAESDAREPEGSPPNNKKTKTTNESSLPTSLNLKSLPSFKKTSTLDSVKVNQPPSVAFAPSASTSNSHSESAYTPYPQSQSQSQPQSNSYASQNQYPSQSSNHNSNSNGSGGRYNNNNGNTRPRNGSNADSGFVVDPYKKNRGILSVFDPVKGFGFVRLKDYNSESVMVHFKNLADPTDRDLLKGDEVEFSIENTPRGLSATQIVRLTVRNPYDQRPPQQSQQRHQYQPSQYQQQSNYGNGNRSNYDYRIDQNPPPAQKSNYDYSYKPNSAPAYPSQDREAAYGSRPNGPASNYGRPPPSAEPSTDQNAYQSAAQYYAAYAAQLTAYANTIGQEGAPPPPQYPIPAYESQHSAPPPPASTIPQQYSAPAQYDYTPYREPQQYRSPPSQHQQGPQPARAYAPPLREDRGPPPALGSDNHWQDRRIDAYAPESSRAPYPGYTPTDVRDPYPQYSPQSQPPYGAGPLPPPQTNVRGGSGDAPWSENQAGGQGARREW